MCNSVTAEKTRPKREQSESQFIMETIYLSHPVQGSRASLICNIRKHPGLLKLPSEKMVEHSLQIKAMSDHDVLLQPAGTIEAHMVSFSILSNPHRDDTKSALQIPHVHQASHSACECPRRNDQEVDHRYGICGGVSSCFTCPE